MCVDFKVMNANWVVLLWFALHSTALHIICCTCAGSSQFFLYSSSFYHLLPSERPVEKLLQGYTFFKPSFLQAILKQQTQNSSFQCKVAALSFAPLPRWRLRCETNNWAPNSVPGRARMAFSVNTLLTPISAIIFFLLIAIDDCRNMDWTVS